MAEGLFEEQERPARSPAQEAAFREFQRKGQEANKTKGKRTRKPKTPREVKEAGGAKLRTELVEIQDRLATVFALPALGMDMAGDAWPAAHTRGHAPKFAHAIVERARANPAFRAQLLRVMRLSDQGGLYLELGMFVIPLLLYYELIPGMEPARRALGVPGRSEIRPTPGYGPEEERVDPAMMRAFAEGIAERQAAEELAFREAERARERDTLRAEGVIIEDYGDRRPEAAAGTAGAPVEAPSGPGTG